MLIFLTASEYCSFHHGVSLDFELLEVVLVLGMAKSAASVMMCTKLTRAVFIEAGWIGFGSV